MTVAPVGYGVRNHENAHAEDCDGYQHRNSLIAPIGRNAKMMPSIKNTTPAMIDMVRERFMTSRKSLLVLAPDCSAFN